MKNKDISVRVNQLMREGHTLLSATRVAEDEAKRGVEPTPRIEELQIMLGGLQADMNEVPEGGDEIGKVEVTLSEVIGAVNMLPACYHYAEKMEAMLTRFCRVVNMTDSDHPDFADSGADVAEAVSALTADFRELLECIEDKDVDLQADRSRA